MDGHHHGKYRHASPVNDMDLGERKGRSELRAMIRANLTPGESRDLDVHNIAVALCDMLHVAGVAIPEATRHTVAPEVSRGGWNRVVRDTYDDEGCSLDDIAESADWDRVWVNFRRMILFWLSRRPAEVEPVRGYDVRYFARVMTRYYADYFDS